MTSTLHAVLLLAESAGAKPVSLDPLEQNVVRHNSKTTLRREEYVFTTRKLQIERNAFVLPR